MKTQTHTTKPRQCGSCGSFCGGGYTTKSGSYRTCKNTAHLSPQVKYVPAYLLENLLNAYAPDARETLAREGRGFMQSDVLAAIDALDKIKSKEVTP